MSRKSTAFADGQPAFSWMVEKLEDNRYKCTCESDPEVFAFGNDEQTAIRDASKAMTVKLESGGLMSPGPGSKL